MDALTFRAVQEMTAEAFLAVLTCVWVVAHMVRTYQLVIMRGENNATLMACLLTPFDNFQNDAGGQLIVEVIDVTHIRLEIVQHKTQLFPCLGRVDRLDWIGQF